MAISSGDNKERRVLSEINVTPFVDVMLVLLVIFMVTAPMLYHGIKVDLPKTATESVAAVQKQNRVVVTITKEGKIFIGEKKLDLDTLKVEIRKLIQKRGGNIKTEQVFLRADSSVPYGRVVSIMGEIKRAGVERLGLITVPVKD